jgi:hypothetical protein
MKSPRAAVRKKPKLHVQRPMLTPALNAQIPPWRPPEDPTSGRPVGTMYVLLSECGIDRFSYTLPYISANLYTRHGNGTVKQGTILVYAGTCKQVENKNGIKVTVRLHQFISTVGLVLVFSQGMITPVTSGTTQKDLSKI